MCLYKEKTEGEINMRNNRKGKWHFVRFCPLVGPLDISHPEAKKNGVTAFAYNRKRDAYYSVCLTLFCGSES